MERAAKVYFLIVLQQKDLGVGAAWIFGYEVLHLDHLKRTVHSSTQVLYRSCQRLQSKSLWFCFWVQPSLFPSKSSAAQIQ